MTDILLPNKICKSVRVEPNSSKILLDGAPSFMIVDLVISQSEGEVLVQISDENSQMPLVKSFEQGVTQLSFDSGISFWRGGALEVINNSVDEAYILVGFVNIEGIDKSKWRYLTNGT